LYTASMSRMKDHVELMERLRELVNNFPRIVGRTSETEFTVAPFDGAKQESPIWWQGEQLEKELRQSQERLKAEKQALQKQHSAQLSKLVRQQEDMAKQFKAEKESLLSSVAGEHGGAMSAMTELHETRVKDLIQQQADLEAGHTVELAQKDSDFGALMDRLHKKEAELHEHIQEENKHLSELHKIKLGIVNRTKGLGHDVIVNAASNSSHPCIQAFLDAMTNAKAAADGMLPVINAGNDANCDLFDTKASALVSSVAAAMLSAAGAAGASRAENSMELVAKMEGVPSAASALLKRLNFNPKVKVIKGSGTAPAEQAAAPAQNRVVALYAHEGKVQEGFTLVGFAKGEPLTLIKSREDGWSRVRTDAGMEGWGPSSYFQKIESPAEPAASTTPSPEVENDDDDDDDEDLDFSEDTPESLIEKLKALLEDAIATAKAVAQRDRELAKLSNQIVDAIDDKVSAAQQSILDGIKLFQKLLAHSKATESGRLLEVNEQLLGTALKLEEAMRNTINSAEGMRNALERSRGAQGEDEFNAKHESWFAALTTSVDAVTDGNPSLMEAVRCVMGRNGKHEELQVATRAITAAVAQLAALSRTKSMTEEGTSQSSVTKNCSTVIEVGNQLLAAARESQDLALASVLMDDFTELTANQAKRLTMATQVNVLKLEKDLEREREKLGQLRRLNYKDK